MALVLLELAAIVLALALLARVAAQIGFSPIPFYLVAGLGLGVFYGTEISREAVQIEADVAVALLLFMLGLEYTGEELSASLRSGRLGGAIDFLFNFTPGVVAGLLFGWSPIEAVVLGGITYISSSGIIAKVLDDLDRLGNLETPAILSVLVIEDLAMAIYLPLVTVALAGGGFIRGTLSVLVAVSAVGLALWAAVRHGGQMSRLLSHTSNEVILLSVLGLLLLVAALGELLQFSAAVGAFLLGIALSGPLVERARTLLGPVRDIMAAAFFVLFAAQLDVNEIPSVALPAFILALATMVTKLATGWIAASSCARPGKLRAGTALMARGEFSVVIADLAVITGATSRLGPLAVTYVLMTALLGPLATRYAGLYRLKPASPAPRSPMVRGGPR